jgi:hypothetical protein
MSIFIFRLNGFLNIISTLATDISYLKDFNYQIIIPGNHPYPHPYIRMLNYFYMILGIMRFYGNPHIIQFSYVLEYMCLLNETFYHEYIDIDRGMYMMNMSFVFGCASLYSLYQLPSL